MKSPIDVKQILRELNGIGRVEQPLTPFTRSFQRAALFAMNIGARRGRKARAAALEKKLSTPLYDAAGKRIEQESVAS